MSKRAEIAAMKAYPSDWVLPEFLGVFNEFPIDYNAEERRIFREGYEQAEKNTIERVLNYLDCVLPNITDRGTVDWLKSDIQKAMEEE